MQPEISDPGIQHTAYSMSRIQEHSEPKRHGRQEVNHTDAGNTVPAGVAHLLLSSGAAGSLPGRLQNWSQAS